MARPMIPPPTIATSKSSTGASFRLAHVHGSKGYAPPAGLIYSPVLDPEECDIAVTEQIPLSKPARHLAGTRVLTAAA